MPKSGHWRIESKTDPRFNMEGRGEFSNGYPIRLPADAVTGIERKSTGTPRPTLRLNRSTWRAPSTSSRAAACSSR